MANWTVTESSTAVTQGTTVSTSVVLTILPLTGFVVSASNFKIGGATNTSGNIWAGGNVDSGINTVTFADVGTAGTISNTVTATVAFTSFAMPGNLKQLYIDIDEIVAVENVDRFFCIRTQHTAETGDNSVNKHVITYASAPTGITTTNESPLVHNLGDGLAEHTHSGTVAEGPPAPGELIFSVDFDANELYGYHYVSEPTIVSLSGAYASYYVFQSSGHLYDNDGNLIFITFKGYYTPPVNVIGLDPDPAGSAASMCELGQSIKFNHVLRQTELGEPGSSLQITSVTIDASNISPTGELRDLWVYGDPNASFILVLTDSDGDTYDFPGNANVVSPNTFTSAYTTSWDPQIIVATGGGHAPITFPAITSDTTYDVTIIPNAGTSTAAGVPTVAGDLRIYQYIDAVVTVELEDSASVYEDTFPTKLTLSGRAGFDMVKSKRLSFSYTITPDMVTSASVRTLNPKSTLDFGLDDATTVSTLLDGVASSATIDVDSTTDVVAGNSINWSVIGQPIFNLENVSKFDIEDSRGLVVGMILSGDTLEYRQVVKITSITGNTIGIDDSIMVLVEAPITFTADGVTVSSITDSNTLVASQTLSGLPDNLSLQFGGSTADISAQVVNGRSTLSGSNVIISGDLLVHSFPLDNKTVKLDINELIAITSS